MPVSSSEVNIANRALAELNERAIANIDTPTTQTEVLVSQNFADLRQELLRMVPWKFAKARATISRTGAAEFDFDSKYQLPAGFIRLLSIEGDTEVERDKNYDIQEDKLLYDGTAASIKLRYIKDQTTVSLWDPLFKRCMVFYLAADLAMPITGKKQLVELMENKFTQALREAVAINGQERPPLLINKSIPLSSRRSLFSTTDLPPQFIDFIS